MLPATAAKPPRLRSLRLAMKLFDQFLVQIVHNGFFSQNRANFSCDKTVGLSDNVETKPICTLAKNNCFETNSIV